MKKHWLYKIAVIILICFNRTSDIKVNVKLLTSSFGEHHVIKFIVIFIKLLYWNKFYRTFFVQLLFRINETTEWSETSGSVPPETCAQWRFRWDCACAVSSESSVGAVWIASWGCKVSSCGHRRLCLDCADAQTDLSLHWTHMSEGTFPHVRLKRSYCI